MTDWAIVHKKTGETQFVKSRGAADPPGIDLEEWAATKLPARPDAHHDFVDGKLVVNHERKARIAEEGRLARMSRAERQEEAIRKAVERMKAAPTVEGQ